MKSAVVDTNVFLRLAFEEPGWEECGRLLDSVYSGQEQGIISAIQISELFTPFEQTNDRDARDKLASTIKKSKLKIRIVDEELAKLSAKIRATEKTPSGTSLALADSIVLATALLEEADALYTLDMDFSQVKNGTMQTKITAPSMAIEQ